MISPPEREKLAPTLPQHRGSVLLLVLVVVAILSLGAASYMTLMQNERTAVRYHGLQGQADATAASCVAYVQALLSRPDSEVQLEGGLVDNPALFQALPLYESDDPQIQWFMTIVSPGMSNGSLSGLRYGLVNESSKLHVNGLLAGELNQQRERLMALPGMNVELADAILDWLDADDLPREFGAEADYYAQLDPPYAPRNGPLRSLEELLSIRGMSRDLLYGLDHNRNYQGDAGEAPRGLLLEADDSTGTLNLGMAEYLTVVSAESTITEQGPRIDLNLPTLNTLHTSLSSQLSAEEAKFIVLYRQYGGQQQDARESRDQNQPASAPANVELDFEKQATTRINSLLDLVGTTVTVTSEEESGGARSGRGGNRNRGRSDSDDESEPDGDEESQTVESPWPDTPAGYQGLLKLYDSATTSSSPTYAGRININVASRPVLGTIPGMSYALADQILARREPEVDMTLSDQRSPLWLLIEGLVTREQFQQMETYITTRGCVYSGQAVGFRQITSESGKPGESPSQIDVVARRQFRIDARGPKPELIDWSDLSSLGRGYSPATLSPEMEP
ncbi:type II secretion system protein GspK [Adhaeretor mobilis]|uniref:General secretion pathway protein K n=1 Tax=Adhaeretor mobilis TaxID=1930276 RepID=A0A517MUM5_9BACT|nr:type II secretion system protein GspK [Adhaeretor mobilis]QDS98591.1 General secretion pathway protein K [Adhaeretor mobilis]